MMTLQGDAHARQTAMVDVTSDAYAAPLSIRHIVDPAPMVRALEPWVTVNVAAFDTDTVARYFDEKAARSLFTIEALSILSVVAAVR